MNIRTLLAVAIAAGLLTGVLFAQEKKKLYRWVDKDGKVQISDQLPPEAVNQARKEINSKGQSTTSNEVDRALTEEERTALALQAKDEEAALKLSEQQKRIEQAMMINYATEEDLQRTYKERIELLQQTIESTDVSIKSIRGSLTGMLAQASESELSNKPVDAVRQKQIQELHAELLNQQQTQAARHVDVKTMEQEFAAVLARYRELRGSLLPATDPAAAPVETPMTPSR